MPSEAPAPSEAPEPVATDDAVATEEAAAPDEPAAGPAGAVARTVLAGLLLVGLVLAGAAVLVATASPDTADSATTATGGADDDAPATGLFGLTDAVAQLPPATLDGFAGGPPVAITDLLGGPPLVVNFWASWCAPCVAEMPDLQALHEASGEELYLLGIDVRDAPPIAERFVADLGITYPQLIDPDEAYFHATGGFGMPTTLFVRPDGSVAYRHTGPLDLAEMIDLVAEHLDVEVTADAA